MGSFIRLFAAFCLLWVSNVESQSPEDFVDCSETVNDPNTCVSEEYCSSLNSHYCLCSDHRVHDFDMYFVIESHNTDSQGMEWDYIMKGVLRNLVEHMQLIAEDVNFYVALYGGGGFSIFPDPTLEDIDSWELGDVVGQSNAC